MKSNKSRGVVLALAMGLGVLASGASQPGCMQGDPDHLTKSASTQMSAVGGEDSNNDGLWSLNEGLAANKPVVVYRSVNNGTYVPYLNLTTDSNGNVTFSAPVTDGLNAYMVGSSNAIIYSAHFRSRSDDPNIYVKTPHVETRCVFYDVDAAPVMDQLASSVDMSAYPDWQRILVGLTWRGVVESEIKANAL